ncbi:MAG TPA: hypothetical protein VLB12_07915 [Gemmatimonadales bacterium]|nr:hypothetical protein [Gemmatimonadales bacterium]
MWLKLVVTLIALSVLVSPQVMAQRLTWSASVGAGGGSWRAATAASWHVQVNPWLQLSLGPRLTRFGGNTKSYRIHDAGSTTLPANLSLAPEVWALNVAVGAEVQPVDLFALGANLDLAGLATGSALSTADATLEPARWSLFRYGHRDLGSLNSEAYIAVPLRHLRIRAGISHFVTGYTVSGQSSARYLRFDTVPFLGVTWTPDY